MHRRPLGFREGHVANSNRAAGQEQIEAHQTRARYSLPVRIVFGGAMTGPSV
jgi:hypothetical protein